MSVGLGTQIALSAALGLSLMFAGCGSSAPPEDDSTNNGPTIPVVGNYPAAGGAGQGQTNTVSGNGFKGWRSDAAGSSGAAGAATAAAGSSGTAGRAAAGSSGNGSAGTASAAGAGGSAGADAAAGSGATSMDDPLDIFGPGASTPSCDGQICVEDKDCAELHPDETVACKFTKCVDFACSK